MAKSSELFSLEDGDDIECPSCKSTWGINWSRKSTWGINWEVEDKDPVVGDYWVDCPKCGNRIYFECRTMYNVYRAHSSIG